MASGRRIGAPDARNRNVLLDAAEQMLVEEGYAAVTSRRLAERAGLKPQLVHYYFHTMEDLLLALLRRGAEQRLEMLSASLRSAQPLWALWRLATVPQARLTAEFIGLALHRDALRADFVSYIERSRELHERALAEALRRHGIDVDAVPPVVWTVLGTSVSHTLVVERSLGVSTGHAETLALCEDWLRRLEGDPPPPDDVGPG